ncbi:MAG TPA: fibronectin type III domain-containing protein, partial [Acidimicrobiales bacterium]|nr:fibronectin type III domain-containing protein [Acidimicrobiales bacterium]
DANQSGAGNYTAAAQVQQTINVVSAPGAPTGLSATPGNTRASLTWSAPASNGGSAITSYNIYEGTSSGAETLLTSVTGTSYLATGLTNGTTYFFEVSAVNGVGPGPRSNEASATPATIPGAPTGLTAAGGNGQVLLTWSAPASNGGSAITSYNIYVGTSSGGETLLTSTGSPGASTTLVGLTNGTTYFFEVTAVNGVGEGPVSNEASATPATVPGAPTALTATAGDGQVALSWTAPASNGGSAITSYNVYEGTSSGGETLLQSTGGTGTTFTATGLSNGTTYYFQVTAVNGVGEGPRSAEVSSTPATTPGAPTALTATAGDGQVALSWTAPASDGGSAITSYNVYEGTSSGGETLLQSTGSTAATFTVTGLTNGTTYYFEVAAVNGVGAGLVSNEAFATPATIPGAPTGLSATPGDSQVSLTWSAPASDGGSAITSYNVYEGTSSGGETLVTNVTGASYLATGLTNGTNYYFEVSAVNGVGEGPRSTEVSATPATTPGVPTALTATRGNGQVTLSWTAPASDGGSAITSYDIYKGTSSGGETLLESTGATGTTFNVTGLTNGTKYYFEVAAVNGVGAGLVSDEASATPATVPGAPLIATIAPQDGQAVLLWLAPASDGGSAVTSYNIYEGTSSGGETLLENTGGTGTTFTVTGLTNGTTYYFEVTAVNGVGEGPKSNEGTVLPAKLAGAPTGLTATRGNGQVALSWTAPASDGGSAIVVYYIYEGTSSGSETLLENTPGPGTSITVTGLTNGTPYYFKVTAVTAVGEGPASNEASATPATVPGAPTGLSASFGNAQVTLSWSAPSSNGGSAVTEYNVYQGTSSGAETLLTTVTGTSYVATGLSNGTVYYFEVSAVNGVGEGARSAEVPAAPSAPPPSPPTTSTSTSTTTTTSTTPPLKQGAWLVAKNGSVFAFGSAHVFNLVHGERYAAKDFVGIAASGDRGGYWTASSDGTVFAFGDAHNYGSLSTYGAHVDNIVGITANSNGTGYWLASSNGVVYTFGNAHNYPDPGTGKSKVHNSVKLQSTAKLHNIIGIVATPDNHGYWLAGSDGQVYTYGDAHNFGSLPAEKVHVNDVVGMAATANGAGYWLIGANGHVYSFGNAHNFGSASGSSSKGLAIVGMARTFDGHGYWVVQANGGISNFGDAQALGATGNGVGKADPIVGVAA